MKPLLSQNHKQSSKTQSKPQQLPLKTSTQQQWRPHSFSSLPSPILPPQTFFPSSQLMLENHSGPATIPSSSALHTAALPAARHACGIHTHTPSVQLYTLLTHKWTSRDRVYAPVVLVGPYATDLDLCRIVAVLNAKLWEIKNYKSANV